MRYVRRQKGIIALRGCDSLATAEEIKGSSCDEYVVYL